ncbi:MAG: hypothetical protein COA62_13075 [Rhodobiaceae bacterium]|nr:MAG: hypothetical protein COA62_13075 [Rhodobiaceae bacterium]
MRSPSLFVLVWPAAGQPLPIEVELNLKPPHWKCGVRLSIFSHFDISPNDENVGIRKSRPNFYAVFERFDHHTEAVFKKMTQKQYVTVFCQIGTLLETSFRERERRDRAGPEREKGKT